MKRVVVGQDELATMDNHELIELITPKLSLFLPSLSTDDASYISGLLLETEMEDCDKVEGIVMMLSDDSGSSTSEFEPKIKDLVEHKAAQWIQEAQAQIQDEKSKNDELKRQLDEIDKQNKEADDMARRKQLIAEYALQMEGENDEAIDMSSLTAEEILAMTAKKKKKHRQKEQLSDLIMKPNLNKAAVKAEQQIKRDANAKAAQAKKDKDKADLAKQKNDAARKKEERQKAAAKGERRA